LLEQDLSKYPLLVPTGWSSFISAEFIPLTRVGESYDGGRVWETPCQTLATQSVVPRLAALACIWTLLEMENLSPWLDPEVLTRLQGDPPSIKMGKALARSICPGQWSLLWGLTHGPWVRLVHQWSSELSGDSHM
jgi:hypothetical protein